MNVFVKLSLFSAIAVSAGSVSACSQKATDSTAGSVGTLTDSLRTFALQMVDGLRRLDAVATIALYGDTAHFVHVDNGNVLPWAQLRAMMTSYFATAKSNPLSVIGQPGVTIVDANNAVVYATHRFQASEGRAAHDGVWTGVLHRFPSGWKIVHSHSSDRRPPN